MAANENLEPNVNTTVRILSAVTLSRAKTRANRSRRLLVMRPKETRRRRDLRYIRCELTRGRELNHTGPGTHALARVVQRGFATDEHRSRARCPGRGNDRNARHRRKDAQRCCRGGGDGGICNGRAHPKGRDVLDRDVVHNGGGRCSHESLVFWSDDERARSHSERAAHHCAGGNEFRHRLSTELTPKFRIITSGKSPCYGVGEPLMA